MAKFKCINKDCNNHGVCIDYYRHRSKIVDMKPIYMDGKGEQILCKNCGKPLDFMQPAIDGFPQVRTQTFSSMSDTDKKRVLMKRQADHDKKDSYTKQYKEAIQRGEIKQ